MAIQMNLDGSVTCTGEADPSRTATFAGPRNCAEQVASIQAFFALEPPPSLPDDSLPGLASRVAVIELALGIQPPLVDGATQAE